MIKKGCNILIVDDHSIFRQGLKKILRRIPELNNIKDKGSAKECLQELKENSYDILFMDIQMPEMDGIELLQIIKNQYPKLKVIALTTFDTDTYIKRMFDLKVDGYLTKTVEFAELKEAIEMVLNDDTYLPAHITNKLLDILERQKAKSKNNEIALSDRELKILACLKDDLTVKETAERCKISERTVNRERQSLLSKFDVKNFYYLILKAEELGFLKDSIRQ